MPVAISPNYNSDDFANIDTLDKKIDFFIDRVKGWHIGVAKELITYDIPHRSFLLLHSVSTYIELISRYEQGIDHCWQVKEHYIYGFKRVYPKEKLRSTNDNSEIPQEVYDRLCVLFYKKVRCAIAHTSFIGSNIQLTTNINKTFMFSRAPDEEEGIIQINPDLMIDDIENNFNEYEDSLRNLNNSELRDSFEKRYDYDYKIPTV